jgi:dihydropyrimidinase
MPSVFSKKSSNAPASMPRISMRLRVLVQREATHRVISLAEIAGVAVMIVHVSNRESMDEIRRAQQKGIMIFGEPCPQYLALTAKDLEGLNMDGAKYVCSPPPRDTASQIACWDGIEQDVFSVLSSDDCPFRYYDPAGKLAPRGRASFRRIPNGIPGVAGRLPIPFTEDTM